MTDSTNAEPDRPPSPTYEELQALLDRSFAQHSAVVNSWMDRPGVKASGSGVKGESEEEVRRWRLRPHRLGMGAPMPTAERQRESASLKQLNRQLASSSAKRKRGSPPPRPLGRGKANDNKGPQAAKGRGGKDSDDEEDESRSKIVASSKKPKVAPRKGVFDMPRKKGNGNAPAPSNGKQIQAKQVNETTKGMDDLAGDALDP